MGYKFFSELANYANKAWKGSYTEEEVRQNAKDYFAEWQYSQKKSKPTQIIKDLCKLLSEDGSKKAKYFRNEIVKNANWRSDNH
ncbi:MAG: hypothetical protein IJA10_10635 [Lachnospiraceae bacterium]|nr:hypothetical protein [Lachnospiraceae bacterium]